MTVDDRLGQARQRRAVVAARRDRVEVWGPDAIGYLQGQLSQDVVGLAVGGTTWTFVLAPQGKVEGWGRLTRLADDRVEVLVDPGAGQAWETRLRRFLMRTRLEMTVTAGVEVLAVRGPGAVDAVSEAVGPADAEGADPAPAWRPAGWPGVDGADVLADRAVAGGDLSAVIDQLGAAGFELADEAVLVASRIAAGIAVWGSELDEDTIPATIGQWAIDASVSFTKGCYTGQELVARIDSRGGNVPRVLHRLSVDGPPPAVGSAVTVGSEQAGLVTSSVAVQNGALALAWVARSVTVDPTGTGAEVDGLSATVWPPPT